MILTIFFVPYPGLIVGAIIRFTSDAKHLPTTQANLVDSNKTYTSLDPPDYIVVYLNRTNTSDTPPDKVIYALKGAMGSLEEPPLERTVSGFFVS